MSNGMGIVVDEEESVKILENVLKMSGLPYRRTKPGEEGGFFYQDENGNWKKFTENIFIKRLEAVKQKER